MIGNDQFVSFSRRIVAAAGKRASEDIEMLRDLIDLQAHIDRAVTDAVRTLRSEHAYSWQDVGRVLGCTRQAAQQRYGRPDDNDAPDHEQPALPLGFGAHICEER